MSDHPYYDVAIIGYGPVGATAANLLGAYGLNVVVIERDLDIYGRARAISTDEEVMRIWQRVGLDRRLQDEMLPGGDVAFVDDRGRPFVQLRPPSRGSGHPAQQFIYQPAVDTTLRAGVDRFDNVNILTRHECLKVLPGAQEVEILTADLDSDSFVRLRAGYVIAADGGASATRGQLGIGYAGITMSERWIVVDTKVKREWQERDQLRFHCDPVRPTVDCPTPLGHHRWEFPVGEGEDESRLVNHEAIWEILNAQGVTDDDVEILRAVVYSHHVRVADRWRVGRVFLAGDAAHAMPPWIGQGMASGVRDVDNLCWKLAGVMRGELPESVLDTYQVEREPHVRETTARAVFVGRRITERRPWRAVAQNRILGAAARSEALRRWLIDRKWIPDARVTEGLLSPVRHPARGRQVPQPRVMGRHGAVSRLDDVLDGRWCVLADRDSGTNAWRAAGATVLRILQPGSAPRDDAIIDVDGDLSRWLRVHLADAVALRPDGYIYAAASSRQPLPDPPQARLHGQVRSCPELTN